MVVVSLIVVLTRRTRLVEVVTTVIESVLVTVSVWIEVLTYLFVLVVIPREVVVRVRRTYFNDGTVSTDSSVSVVATVTIDVFGRILRSDVTVSVDNSVVVVFCFLVLVLVSTSSFSETETDTMVVGT